MDTIVFFFKETAQSWFEVFQNKCDANLLELGILRKFMNRKPFICWIVIKVKYVTIANQEMKCDIQYDVVCLIEFACPFQTTWPKYEVWDQKGLVWRFFGVFGKSRNLRWRVKNGRHLAIMTLLPRDITSSLRVVDLKGDVFKRTIYPANLTVKSFIYTCRVMEGGTISLPWGLYLLLKFNFP